jgi:N-acetylneuraminate synthase
MAVTFVAEVSSNHHQDLDRCLAFIDAAAEIGCDAVKFQLFKIDELFAEEVLSHNEVLQARQQWELPNSFLPDLSRRCKERHLQFACTPFYLDGVSLLEPYVDFFKVASYELLWDALLIACAQTEKPLILSTGMATTEEISHAVEVVRTAGCQDLTLLHCVSGYPVPCGECNLGAIETIRALSGCQVGWSDHSVNPGVISRAVHRWGATMIEFHLDLDQTGSEYQTGHCWLPEEIGPVISSVQEGILADGTGRKDPAPSEKSEREWRADPLDGLRPLQQMRKTWVASLSVQ